MKHIILLALLTWISVLAKVDYVWVNAYPTISSSKVTVTVYGDFSQRKITVGLYNIVGQRLKDLTADVYRHATSRGVSEFNVDLSDLKIGSYTLFVTNAKKGKSVKIIVSR